MKNLAIHWYDDSVNPVVGCEGCELWPNTETIRATIHAILTRRVKGHDIVALSKLVVNHFPPDRRPSDILKNLKPLVAALVADCDQSLIIGLVDELDVAVRALFRCYAGNLALKRTGNRGYPECFGVPTPFPGRMAKAAVARDLTGTTRPEKPWLNNLPRLIAIGDLGECLAPGIPCEWLRSEIIDVVTSTKGQRHIWLWSTKQTARMFEFSEWLWHRGVNWPENLVPIASVTGQDTVHRVRELVQMNVRLKGVAVEPLWEAVELPLNGIQWVVVGGEVGPQARPFPLRWARDLQRQCEERRVALFFSQLGKTLRGETGTCELHDKDGRNWNEWPIDLQVRQFPAAFSRAEMLEPSTVLAA